MLKAGGCVGWKIVFSPSRYMPSTPAQSRKLWNSFLLFVNSSSVFINNSTFSSCYLILNENLTNRFLLCRSKCQTVAIWSARRSSFGAYPRTSRRGKIAPVNLSSERERRLSCLQTLFLSSLRID